MDITTMASAYGSLKAAKELLGAAFDAKVDAEAKAKILDAQAKLGDVQDKLFALREDLAQLQHERDGLQRSLAELEAWQRRIDSYDLVRTTGGAVVLKFRGDPHHFVCPSCVNKREIHILQDNRTLSGKHRCTGCGSEYPVDPQRKPDPIRYPGPQNTSPLSGA